MSPLTFYNADIYREERAVVAALCAIALRSELRQQPLRKRRSFGISEPSSDVGIENDSLPLPAPAAKGDDEDPGDDLIRAAPAKGKGKAVQAHKHKF
ncbi:hypothetical protein H4582DRAFT_2088035 [Lactarius indigo]|nr:hypothetical protein H4582DRAFT_2088035 [Lactarius indigo]